MIVYLRSANMKLMRSVTELEKAGEIQRETLCRIALHRVLRSFLNRNMPGICETVHFNASMCESFGSSDTQDLLIESVWNRSIKVAFLHWKAWTKIPG